jgi:hypothetical protein
LTNLFVELFQDRHVDGKGVLFGGNGHGSVVDVPNSPGQVRDGLGGHLPLSGDGSREFTSVILDVLDVSLDLGSELLQVLNNGRLDGSCERGVRVCNDPGLVPDGVEDILGL